ncbi:MAG: hypothetical protein ACLRIT_12085 [Blautia sp.]
MRTLRKWEAAQILTEIVNDSITQTLTRSIYTSLTTFRYGSSACISWVYLLSVNSHCL